MPTINLLKVIAGRRARSATATIVCESIVGAMKWAVAGIVFLCWGSMLAMGEPLAGETGGRAVAPIKHGPSVVFVSCCLPKGFFWPQVEGFMRAAADDLEIVLEVQYAEMNHLRMVEMAKGVIHRPRPPDYLIVDNYNAGFQLAARLIAEIERKGVKAADGRFHLAALAGDSATPAGLERIRGLKASVVQHPDVVLSQVVNGQWQEENARRLMPRILRRYPEVTGIWSANDEMALGALAAVRDAGRTPGRDIFIAGINWKREALESVRDDNLVVSIGGHFMMGGWALVLLARSLPWPRLC